MNSRIEITIIYFLIFMLGASVGSFIEALAYRRQEGISIVSPPSFCNFCKKRIKPYDLVPVLSFLWLKGKTRCCKNKIPIFTLLVEIILGLLYILAFSLYGPYEGIFFALAFTLSLLLTITDIKSQEIYDTDLIILLLVGFLYRLIYIGIDFRFLRLILIFILGFMFVRFVSRGGIGDGDLFFYLGLFLFLENDLIPILVLLSVWIGAIHAIIKALKTRSLKGKIAFCPSIFFAFVLLIIFKDLL
ncbi:A24 family peptidase [uncultured Anaerococcus sp.]|uniref:prepilin peptidase n=1 Tax=uncultured Anaerococcus sp. TaxID=293428 RepID=UPI0025EF6C1B|nr:A24 family peptidase [uncultured Anaerococcus sp.]